MVKKFILLLSAAASIFGSAQAQVHCYTDEVGNQVRAKYPEQVAKYEAQLKKGIDRELSKIDFRKLAKTTGSEDTILPMMHVPIVFHIIHDYGYEYVSDNDIYAALDDINQMYSRSNPDSAVIPAYAGKIPGTNVEYKGKANIQFHLPSKDPQGNPTHGITRHRSYLTSAAGDGAKDDLWPPDSYLNIWIIRAMSADHSVAAAYAYQPPTAAAIPFSDGVIVRYEYILNDHTLAHEIGHELALSHPWGNTNNAGVSCGDDEVDDTPPTRGHNVTGCTVAALTDTLCAQGYSKQYSGINAHNLFDVPFNYVNGIPQDVIINYPDTVNSENVMDYTYCSHMFTYLQCLRMRGTLLSSVAGRNHLISQFNLDATGALAPWVDIPPVADFSVEKGTGLPILSANERTYFLCANTLNNPSAPRFYFKNRSWNDTVTSVSWEFSNGADTATSTNMVSVHNRFATPGWVDIKLTANSMVNGVPASNTLDVPHAVYAADPNGTPASGYYQEFGPNNPDLEKYPIFNYYNNPFKWELVNYAGYYDNNSIRFTGYDHRSAQNQSVFVGSPQGDFDDFFTPAFDLSAYANSANCNLNFMSAGAFRTTNPSYMRDTLEIRYSTDCGGKWTVLKLLTKAEIANNGTRNDNFVPTWQGEWKEHNIDIPVAARTSATFFRFRYKTGTDEMTIGTGNNFYLDRIYFSDNTLSVNPAELAQKGVIVAPNPTTGATYVVVSNADNSTAQVQVTDVTGKVVYSTSAKLNGAYSRIEIPAEVIAVKGLYMVQVVTGTKTHTEKLVSY